jgi:transcriptional regulator with XRE-family HTH domain
MFVYVETSPPMPRGEPNPYALEEIAKRLFLLRKALNNTQAQMGALCGVSGNAWQNYEAAVRRIELDNVFQLESATGAPQEWVYRGFMARMPLELAQKIELAKREIEREKRKSSNS